MSVPVFLAPRDLLLRGDRAVLGGAEGRHAAAVRRLRAGERVDLTDGAGLVAECEVREALKDSLAVEVLRRREEPAPSPRVVVVQGLPKGDRGELAVEMMTEAGVDEIVPWAASRCVTQWRGDRADKALNRWRNTAREAGKQARRFHLPEVPPQETTARVAERVRGAAAAFVLHEEAKTPLSSADLPREGDIVLVVGPEGGVADAELEAFAAAGAVPALLGPTVLRTSTAGVAAAAVILARTGRW
ncbi:16S rRNA (uracil(1498)-N(3))-methyltransferase [Bailinhaonella thermotolerans]|uniref:Ribosomal RNA small subunit methyltransferase E n=1 Tax=Bailinhaonella thermotolerans TaxID=1070861 RepID=A0A3A4ALD1_9ACTN|nr:16S rRNA (uracil(1498)-N(3))-methyltransferase [Bailinhaonella thermotolerans]RJL26470.1 16S rRNA (uracil(1498)-N(3))-methyltransferase [Bailinhaonella thermotolerans]